MVVAAVTQRGDALQFASNDLKGEKEVVMAAITQNGCALEYACRQSQNDKEVVVAAVTQQGFALQFASNDLQRDEEVVMAAITQNGCALKYVPEWLQNYEEVVLAAVTQQGDALEYVSEELQNDNKDIVLAAVTQNGCALKYVSERLYNDPEVVHAAFMQLVIKRYNVMDTYNEDFHVRRWICRLVSKQILVPSDIIHVSSARGLHWDHGMSELIEQDCSVLDSQDEATGLLPFMTFASRTSEESWKYDLSTLFAEMIKKLPQTVRLHKTYE